jgi:hypothetical protein
MPTTGAYEFKLAAAALAGIIVDENNIQRGEWAWVDRTQDWADGTRRWLIVYARCPDCGFLSTVWRVGAPAGHDHELDGAGILTPSVQCPHEPCGFHTQPTKLLNFIDLR